MKTKKIYDFSANDMTTIKSPRKTTIINKNKSIVTYDFKSRKPKNSSVINKIINQKKVNKKIVNIKTEVEDLLYKLVQDYHSTLPVEERIFNPNDRAALIYNLFQGNYKFSFNTYNELFKLFCNI
jgi:hypothetical protein